jgi:hypothetical protein
MTAQGRQAQAMDASDDAYCRKRADSTVAYDQCRKMQLRQAAKANPGAGTVDVGGAMQQAGAHLQTLSPPPPTVCTSAPWLNGVRTTCQ